MLTATTYIAVLRKMVAVAAVASLSISCAADPSPPQVCVETDKQPTSTHYEVFAGSGPLLDGEYQVFSTTSDADELLATFLVSGLRGEFTLEGTVPASINLYIVGPSTPAGVGLSTCQGGG